MVKASGSIGHLNAGEGGVPRLGRSVEILRVDGAIRPLSHGALWSTTPKAIRFSIFTRWKYRRRQRLFFSAGWLGGARRFAVLVVEGEIARERLSALREGGRHRWVLMIERLTWLSGGFKHKNESWEAFVETGKMVSGGTEV
jgi:hypothetical protein